MASRRLRSFLGTFVTLSVLVAAGVAGARGVLFTASVADDAVEEIVQEIDPCADEEPVEGVESDPAQADPVEGEEDPEECQTEDPEPEGEGSKDENETREVTQGDRDAACDAAAGIADNPLPEGERLTGLPNAISHVLENCMKNPQAPGLVNALERLAENRERKEARDEAKAERKAEREARKAESHAGRGAGPGGGPPPHAGPPSHAKGGQGG